MDTAARRRLEHHDPWIARHFGAGHRIEVVVVIFVVQGTEPLDVSAFDQRFDGPLHGVLIEIEPLTDFPDVHRLPIAE
jgi:hypothetical protein